MNVEKKKTQNITVHINYNCDMTVFDLQESLSVLNGAFAEFYEKEQISLSESNRLSPRVASVSNGSLVVDIILPVAGIVLPIVYDIIKTAFESKRKYSVEVYSARTFWSAQDNYELSKAVLKEYALKRSNKPIDDFMNNVSLPNIHKKESIKAKIRNTKQLMCELNIQNSLDIPPLKNYSKDHRVQFERACRDLNL